MRRAELQCIKRCGPCARRPAYFGDVKITTDMSNEQKFSSKICKNEKIGLTLHRFLARRTVLWCNGSTTGFGSVCPGSNPGKTTAKKLQLPANEVIAIFVFIRLRCGILAVSGRPQTPRGCFCRYCRNFQRYTLIHASPACGRTDGSRARAEACRDCRRCS